MADNGAGTGGGTGDGKGTGTGTGDGTGTGTGTGGGDGKNTVLATGGGDGKATGTGDGKGTGTGDGKAVPEWKMADDWRERLATGSDGKVDEGFLNVLKRHNTWDSYAKAGRDAQLRISAGEVFQPLKADATEAETKAWREKNGIPTEVGGYLKDLPQGMVIGEDDKPLADSFLGIALKNNVAPGVAHQFLGWYYDTEKKVAAEMKAADDAQHDQCIATLTQRWSGGPGSRQYDANGRAAFEVLDLGAKAVMSADGKTVEKASLRDRLLGARLADGTLLGDDPDAMEFLSMMGRELVPQATLVSSGTGAGAPDPRTELEGLRKEMRTDINAWHKSPEKQARYQELIKVIERQDARKRA